MPREVTLAEFRQWMLLFADRVDEEKDLLTQLDAAIGDGDHGVNMQNGMRKVRARVEGMEDCQEISVFLRTVAMTLISSVGGAAGPLYGAFFLRAAKEFDSDSKATIGQLAVMFRVGVEAIQQRGEARLGDKTMVDALVPAMAALERAATQDYTVAEALEKARQAAEHGTTSTIDMEAQKGRASYLGPRSIGHQDPGATSSYFLIETAARTLGQGSETDQEDDGA